MSKLNRLIRSLPSLYRAETSTMLNGLLQAWALGDDDVTANIIETKNQLYVKKATGRYLDYLGNNVGVPRSPDLGIEDVNFQDLIPVMSFYPKQVRSTIIDLLDVFWGEVLSRANVNSGNIAPFDLGPAIVLTGTAHFRKDSKVVIGTGTLFTAELQLGMYIKPTTADGTLYAKVVNIISDTELELESDWNESFFINSMIATAPIRTLSYIADSGTERTIRIKPNAFSDITAATITELSNYINNSLEHNRYITAELYIDPILGDKLNIRTNTPGLHGSIQITGGDAADFLRLNFDNAMHTDTRVSVFEINPNELIVRIPSSIPILRRSLKGAAHLKNTKTQIMSSAEPFDFSTLGPSSTLTLDVDGNPYTLTFTHASDFNDPTDVSAVELASIINTKTSVMKALNQCEGELGMVVLETTDGSIEYQITGGTANTLLNFPTTLQEDLDIIRTDYPSSYIFDKGQLYTVTGIRSELTAQIEKGSINTSINLNDVSGFPNQPGFLLFNFGRKGEEGPIRYNSRPNNSTLLIDAAHIFSEEHAPGRKVNLVVNYPTIPRVTGDDYPVFLTGTDQAREAAQALVRKIIAAGVVIRFIIEFPEFLFVCAINSPSISAEYQGSRTGLNPLVF